MRGEVEVIRNGEVLTKESNLITSGAGSILATMFTTPSRSLSAIDSTLLDVSNYSIQAISFGTGERAFKTNAHYWTPEKYSLLVALPVAYKKSAAAITYFQEDFSGVFYPEVGMPIPPNPDMATLEEDTSVSAYEDSAASVAVSENEAFNLGQHLNYMPSSIFQNDPTVQSIASGNYGTAMMIGSVLGAFPGEDALASGVRPDGVSALSAVMGSSTFNTYDTMDKDGFATRTDDSASGLYKAPMVITTWDSSGVKFEVQLGPGDIQSTNMYGGIYHLGLWSIDLNASLLAGNTPPLQFDVLNNERKYKLVTRKAFAKDLTTYTNTPGGDPGFTNFDPSTNLTIIWRLFF